MDHKRRDHCRLWEDDGDPEKKLSYLCHLRRDLQNTLKLRNTILKQRSSAIAVERLECDLYDWLEKRWDSRYPFGEYMNQYSWVEALYAEPDEFRYGPN